MGEVEIKKLTREDEEAWDDFLKEAEDATFWHQIGWKRVIEKTFGHKSYYLVAREEGKIKGVLPLFFMKTPFFGNFLVSVPFMAYGGVASNMSKEVDRILIEEAIRITKEMGADYLELRSLRDYGLGLQMNRDYVTFIFPLERESLEEAWEKDLPRKKRNNLRKAQKEKVEVETGQEYLRDFFEILCRSFLRLGTRT